ncbi:hypothetical protein BU25DRAFT_415585 [Macroventuria anomochaeta]|uniref:Uncharacterized protein n=1 Tax=Macroventuria anomochaeta TaxID=301207 RepID=A0ACB6RKY6_9PLEO|nr:uncharacterized protein BU25DRAFT_415585 [Macroventuria anomochaeta]KAF2622060.1 hypothetical protein BU25DRAFT_415585 [Macroventuria anomochaeta]
MAAQKSSRRARPSKPQARPRSPSRVVKRKLSSSGLKCRDGLLNTTIPLRSGQMQIARRNYVESPLLHLPGELRDKIWRYALGEHQVDIQDLSHEEPINSIYDIRTLYPDTLCPPGYVRPTFQLPKVCRQIYVEASPYVYSLNTFAFHSMATLDRWIKSRCVGQKRLIASLDIPRTYMRMYRTGFRRSFRSKFPNISRLGVDNWTLFCDYDQIRRLPENKGKGAIDMWVEAKANIITEIQEKEGQGMSIDWHGNSA